MPRYFQAEWVLKFVLLSRLFSKQIWKMSSTCAELDPSASKLGICEVCSTENSKYKCPRCDLKTCSLDCVTTHKRDSYCNGKRDKTCYKPLSKFSNLDLLSDYRLLEDITRAVDNCKRNPLKRYTRFRQPLPIHLSRLRAVCFRRNISLSYLPQHFTRHKVNTTYVDFKTQIVYWRVEFIFPQGNNIKIVEEKVVESTPVSTVLSKYLDVSKCPEVYKSHLKFYHAAGMSDVEILLKAEQVKSDFQFHLLDTTLSLQENLENKNILEFPVIYVIRKSFKDEYDIIEDDKLEKEMVKLQDIDHKPFHYFDSVDDTVVKKKKHSVVSDIHKSAKQLRNLINLDGFDESSDTDEEERMVIESTKKRELNIPYYEQLVSNKKM